MQLTLLANDYLIHVPVRTMIVVQTNLHQDQAEASAPCTFVDVLCDIGSSVDAGLSLPHQTVSTE
jgi:hypothetical protein